SARPVVSNRWPFFVNTAMRVFTIWTMSSGPTASELSDGLRVVAVPCGPRKEAPSPSNDATSSAGGRVPWLVCSTPGARAAWDPGLVAATADTAETAAAPASAAAARRNGCGMHNLSRPRRASASGGAGRTKGQDRQVQAAFRGSAALVSFTRAVSNALTGLDVV